MTELCKKITENAERLADHTRQLNLIVEPEIRKEGPSKVTSDSWPLHPFPNVIIQAQMPGSGL